jgi:hypothetical protein
MKPFRKNVAIAIDGGGIKGIIVTQALAILESYLRRPVHEIFRLAVGTSTGSIISAGIACGITARQMNRLYTSLGNSVFPGSLRKAIFPVTRYRYPDEPLANALLDQFGGLKMGDLWFPTPKTDLVITAYDLQENRTLFIKPWKAETMDWPVAKAVQASCSVPTYFPPVNDRFIDGGVGSYANPCYVAAFEARECLNWDPQETTLISIGTGREPDRYDPGLSTPIWAWDWIGRIFGVFLQSADVQQVHLVKTYFKGLDFRRFQINLREPIAMDDASKIDQLLAYGTRLGRMMVKDQVDRSDGVDFKLPEVLMVGA